jgi:allantoicase
MTKDIDIKKIFVEAYHLGKTDGMNGVHINADELFAQYLTRERRLDSHIEYAYEIEMREKHFAKKVYN